MAMRLQELHPALVHFPIALMPASLIADAVGRATGSEELMAIGKRSMPLAAASGLIAGLAGIIAQQTVELDEHTRPILITHRNLNLGAVALAFVMAGKRQRRRRPSVGYLLAGLAGVATVTYSAYLGGHMVYEHGVAVKAAGGLKEEAAPRLTPDNVDEVSRLSAEHLREGLRVTLQEFQEGEVAPYLAMEKSEPHTGTGIAAV